MLCTGNRSVWHSPAKLKQRSRPLQAFANPYKILQISETSDPSEIKRAYRKLALKHHPDISDHPEAEEEFVKIQQAYEMLSDRKAAAQADPTGKGWDFHDWYWDFMSSSRWNSQWKKHGQAGPSPFAATPSHRDQWQAQLGRLKQKAAFRRAKQQAQQQAQSTAQQDCRPTSKESSLQQEGRPNNDSKRDCVQEAAFEHERSGGAASTSKSSTLRQDAVLSANETSGEAQRLGQTQDTWSTGSVQKSDDSDYCCAQDHVNRAEDLKYSTTVTGNRPISHDSLSNESCQQAGLAQSVPCQGARHDALQQSKHLSSGHYTPSPSQQLEPAEGRDCTAQNVHQHFTAPSGPVTYSHTAEEHSKTATDRVQSQLMGLRRRAARKVQS